jgi:hypothetical protein
MLECITIILVAIGLLALGVKLVFALDRKMRKEELREKLTAQLHALVEDNGADCPVCYGGEVYPCPLCNPEAAKADRERAT